MSSHLYRLYAVQSFKGEKVAVYIDEGEFPDAELLSDAQEIVDKNISFVETIKSKPDLYKTSTNSVNRNRLVFYTRILRRSQKLISENNNVDKAIFIGTTFKKEWRGEQNLYYNKFFDTIKCDEPEFTGCKKIGTIII